MKNSSFQVENACQAERAAIVVAHQRRRKKNCLDIDEPGGESRHTARARTHKRRRAQSHSDAERRFRSLAPTDCRRASTSRSPPPLRSSTRGRALNAA